MRNQVRGRDAGALYILYDDPQVLHEKYSRTTLSERFFFFLSPNSGTVAVQVARIAELEKM